METDKTPNQSQVKNTTPIPTLTKEYRKLHVRPWKRYFARSIDLKVFYCAVAILYPKSLYINFIMFSWLIIFSWFLIEPVFLSLLGTTLGKFLFNITVRDLNGNKPKFYSAFIRSFQVWLTGYGLGAPFINLLTLSFSYSELKNTGTTVWDKNKFIVTHENSGRIKSTISFLIIVILIIFTPVSKNVLHDHALNYAYKKEIEKINKTLPKIYGKIELLKTNFSNNTLTQQFRLAKEKKDINISNFYTVLLSQFCDKSHPIGYNRSFELFDKKKNFITTIIIKPSDCK